MSDDIKAQLQRMETKLDSLIGLATSKAVYGGQSSGSGSAPTVFPNYGKSKGAPIAGASQQDLDYYAAGARKSLGDPAKARFHDKERALLEAIELELAKQGGATSGEVPSDDDAPPPF